MEGKLKWFDLGKGHHRSVIILKGVDSSSALSSLIEGLNSIKQLNVSYLEEENKLLIESNFKYERE